MTTWATDEYRRLSDLLPLYLRAPTTATVDAQNAVTFVFEPPLTPAEQATYNRIARLAKSLVTGITATEWQALEPDIAGLTTYQGLTSPTLAQTVLAVKAQSRILRAILRD